MRETSAEVEVPSLEAVRARLHPPYDLEQRIKAFLREQLGGVLPPDPSRGLDWYYDWVVLGERSLEAYAVLHRHRDERLGPVLDVGSGLGTFVLLANALGMPALGVEPGDAELALATERADTSEMSGIAGFRSGVGERLPVDDGQISGVLLHDVLEHVTNWRAVLQECRRVLAPGGVLYVKGPSYTFRFTEPHFRVPWLPMLPRPLARRYLAVLERDVDYFEHIGYRRRGAVLRQLRSLGLELAFPRAERLRAPESINRPWARRLAHLAVGPGGRLRPGAALLAESPLQATIDVVARKPLDNG